jgi:hypothetical protein
VIDLKRSRIIIILVAPLHHPSPLVLVFMGRVVVLCRDIRRGAHRILAVLELLFDELFVKMG